MVVETMMAKNRENRYATPDDLLLDLKCLMRGESPLIAAQEAESLASLSAGDASEVERGPSEGQMVEVAGYVNSRHMIIAALAVLLAVSGLTNFILIVGR
jgi:serine/threonine-protein kinase